MDKLDKIKKDIEAVRVEAKNKAAGYIVTALGLVAGLAWNDAVKALIETYFPAGGQNIWAKFTYAFFLTLIIVPISYYLVKIFGKKEEEKIKKENKKEGK